MVKAKSSEDMNGTGYEWEYAKKIDNRTTGQKIANFIFNPVTHAILGRTVKSWGALLLFYAIFYSILALLFAICMKVLLLTISNDYPKWQLTESIIGTNPGLGFRPMANDTEAASVIRFNGTNKESWVDEIKTFLKSHNRVSATDAVGIDCSMSRRPDLGKNEYCKINTDSFGDCSSERGYGYWVNKPCIFIKLNRIYNWEPAYYNTTESLEHVPIPSKTKVLIKEAMKENPNQVWVSCHGQSPHDEENQGDIAYYPGPGFPNYFYPYVNTKAYVSPLVVVQFRNVTPGVLVNMECRAWARNIEYKANAQQREGSVHFELQYDLDMKLLST